MYSGSLSMVQEGESSAQMEGDISDISVLVKSEQSDRQEGRTETGKKRKGRMETWACDVCVVCDMYACY